MFPPTSVISSFVGTTAMVPFWFTRALSSLSACEPAVPFGLVASVAVNGVQPLAGSTKAASSAMSLPLSTVCAPASAVLFAAVAWAVCPFAVSRYWLITLSLWSWSTRAKSRAVSHGCPSLAVPTAGTLSVPRPMAALAAL